MQQVVKAIDMINKMVGILLALMLGVMSILIILQVISRFVINLPLTWSEELSRYLMIYIVFLGASLAMRHNKLISIELLPETLTGNKRKSVIILVMIISIIFFGILFMQGIDMLPLVQMQSSPGLQLSMAIPYASIPIGSFLLALNSLAVILDELSTKKEGES
ncbi:TRAP transporter small permease [Cytobacillus oceanisediminis]|uniref:TRAP transporter small permease n=1 Tax=Cytobacillus oceanisediminis TaxID=665099 RepID=UPI0011A28CF7|nr:TRAP transporter small permease [Cytobacillus oceanisediminis]